MKLKPLARLFSLVLLMLMPSLVALQPPQGGAQSIRQKAQAFIGLELKNDTLSNQLYQHAKAIETAANPTLSWVGLQVDAIGKNLHLTLFDAQLAPNELIQLAQVVQKTIQTHVIGTPPSFYNINFEPAVTIMNNIIVVKTTGTGNTLIGTVAKQIYGTMGISPQYQYNGHISIARISLIGRQGGPTTQEEKNKITGLLQKNPSLVALIQSVPLPSMRDFKLYSLYINYNFKPLVSNTSMTEIKEGKLVRTMQAAVVSPTFTQPSQPRAEGQQQTPQKQTQWRTLAQELATLGQTIESKLSGLTAADLREFKQFMIDTGYDQSSPTVYRIVKDKAAQ